MTIMTDKTTGTIDTRRCFAVVIAVVMALTMFTGVTGVSHAATVAGAKATNYGFRMVRVSWSAVKVQVPQKPEDSADPADLVDPVDPADSVDPTDPSVDQSGEPASGQTDPAAGQASDPATDPVTQDGEPAADSSVEPMSDAAVDPAADPNADPVLQDGGDGSELSAPVEPAADPVTGADEEPAADPAVNPLNDSAMDQTDEPVLNPPVQTEPKPVYDVITYKVYRATSMSGKYKLVKTTKATSFINKGLTIGERYYYKVVAYKSSGERYGASSTVSIKVAKKVTANMTLLKKGDAFFNYRIAAKQKLYQYDTLQGACANGGYAYLTLYNRRVEKCKIVKVKLSDLSVVKVSAALPIYHGNNLTYNTKKKRIIATCCTTSKNAKNRVVLINPSTLRITSIKNIVLTKKVKNLPRKVRKKNKGFTALTYNEKHNCYVARLRQNDNILILNKDLKPLRYVVLKGKKTGLLVQGIETVGNYIYDVRSFKGRYHYCMVTVHTMAGKYVGQMKFPYGASPGKELECIFHNGKQFYAGCYYSTSQMDDTKRNHVNRINLIYRLNNL